jgi:hypothetical protein
MTTRERQEWRRLSRIWAVGRASSLQIRRCMELDRKAKHETRLARRAR